MSAVGGIETSVRTAERGGDGLSRETWDHLRMRALASHDVILTDVAVPADWTGVLEPAGGASRAGRDPVAVAVLSLCSRTHTPQDDTIAAEVGCRTLARDNA